MKNFLAVDDFSGDEIKNILARADYLQQCWKGNTMPQTLKGEKVALWFFGQGFRNRVAFEIGARSLGADISFIPGDLGVHEPIQDIAHYINNWFSMAVIRCYHHADLERFTADSRIPVINARTSFNHPCEIIGDLQFIHKERGSIDNLTVVFVGEVTNLCMSWFEAARVLPINVIQVGPSEYLAKQETLRSLNMNAVGHITTASDILDAVTNDTDVLYTDCWPSNGNKETIKELFLPYQITKQIVGKMNRKGFYMPCPPITRGEELTEDSLTSPRYCDYRAKEYLLHSQNAIMEYCMNDKLG